MSGHAEEIENFLLDPALIHSYLCRSGAATDLAKVESIVNAVVDELIEELPVLVADGYQTADRKLALPTAMKMAKALIKQRREDGLSWTQIIGGKRALSMISAQCQTEWGTQLSAMSLCRHMQLPECSSRTREGG